MTGRRKSVHMLLEARNIHKTYQRRVGELRVLQGVALNVEAGEAVAIQGPSGAGKSTLLHILGGLDHPDRGSVWYKDQNLYALAERARARIRAREIGLVFQSYHLLPEMEVLENVLLPARALTPWRAPPAAAQRRAMELLEIVGLAARSDHTPLELSGGEQQRVALARAMMNDPPLVLADEPTGNLDETTGRQILDALFALTRDRGHTLIVVTHDPRVAARCDRRLRLLEGTLMSDVP